MDNRKHLLLASAARLYSLGIDLEAARERLRKMVEQGVSYQSEEMRQAYQDFKELEQQKVHTLHQIAVTFNMTLSEFLDFPELNEYPIDDEQ